MILDTARTDGVEVNVWVEQEPGSGGKDSARAAKGESLGMPALEIMRPGAS